MHWLARDPAQRLLHIEHADDHGFAVGRIDADHDSEVGNRRSSKK